MNYKRGQNLTIPYQILQDIRGHNITRKKALRVGAGEERSLTNIIVKSLTESDTTASLFIGAHAPRPEPTAD